MKKIVVFFSIILFMNASIVTQKYLDYTNKLVNYSLLLENFDKIRSPLEKDLIVKKKEKAKKLIKIIRIDLLAVFNNKAYVLIREFVGDQLINSYRKWLKIGDFINNCRLVKIEFSKIEFNCQGKKLIKTLNSKNLNIKEQK